MHRTFVQSLVAAAIGAAIAGPAAAGPPSKYNFRGETAGAGFSSSSDCVDTSTYVAVGDAVRGEGASQEAFSWVYVNIYQHDGCQDEIPHYIDGYRELEAADFVRGGGRSATLATTVDAYDYQTDSPVQLTLDLSWTTTGVPVQYHNASHFRSPSSSYSSHEGSRSRDATATGTVNDGITNYTPEPSEWAYVGTNVIGGIIRFGP
jgi:hypothetical protein